jgi:hypothetical protein
VPVVGSVLLVSDLLNLVNLIGQLASPLYALLCNGPIAGLAAGIPAMLMGPGLQGKVWRSAFMSPVSRVGMLKGILPRFGFGAALGLAIQAPQVTSSLWGYGVALGGIVGAVTQTATGLALTAQGDTVHWPGGFASGPGADVVLPPQGSFLRPRQDAARDLNRLINRPLAEDNVGDLVRLHQAATVMACAPSVLARPDYFTPEQYTETLAMATVAQQLVYTRLAGYAWQDVLGQALEQQVSCYAVPTSGGAALLEEQGIRPGDWIPFDLPGHPLMALGGDVVVYDAPRCTAGIERFCGQQRNTPWGSLAGELVNEGVDHAWEHLTGQQEALRWRFQPDWALLTSLTEVYRLPVTGRDDQALWRCWMAARAKHEDRPAGKWTAATWDGLAAAHGVTLMKLLPPDAPWPEPWPTWLREQQANRPA